MKKELKRVASCVCKLNGQHEFCDKCGHKIEPGAKFYFGVIWYDVIFNVKTKERVLKNANNFNTTIVFNAKPDPQAKICIHLKTINSSGWELLKEPRAQFYHEQCFNLRGEVINL